MRLGVAVALLLVSSTTWADGDRSGDSDAVQASLDCTVGGKALSPLAPNVISGHVTCAVIFDGFSAEGLTAEAWLVQNGVESEHRTATPTVGGDDTDDQLRFDPFRRGDEVQPCRDFTIHAQVKLEDDVVWSTDLAVAAKCKKPKKISAKLSCTFVGADATVYAWPGNGAKKKPPIDDTLACWVRGPKSGVAGFTATIAGHGEELWQDDDTHAWTGNAMLEPDDDFTPCEPYTVVASIANTDGQVVWAGKLAIAHGCR